MPKTELPDSMDATIRILEGYLRNPLTLDGEQAKDLLRKKRKKAVRRASIAADEDEDAARPRKRRRKQAEIQQFKSAQFIEDSDDDPVLDAEFYAREAARRDAHRAKMQLGQIMQQMGKSKGKRGRDKSATAIGNSEAEEEEEEQGDEAGGPTSFSSDSEATRPSVSHGQSRKEGVRAAQATPGQSNEDDLSADEIDAPAISKKRRAVFASDEEE